MAPRRNRDPVALLRPYLVGERPRDDGEWDLHCPLHDDKKRSAQINFEKGVWYCHAEGIGGNVNELLEQIDDWVPPPNPSTNGHAAPPDLEVVSDAKVRGWCSALMSNEVALEDLVALRGLKTKTLAEYEIGWDSSNNCYTIPVRSESGDILNVRRYQTRPPSGRRKIWGIKGINSPQLYPIKALEADEIIICEGELDAIITNQNGFPAITKTGAALSWEGRWSEKFAGKFVYLCHDCDETGQKANRKIGHFLAKFAAEVRIVHLPYPITEKGGKDLTDWWVEHDQDTNGFRRMMEEAEVFEATSIETEEPERLDPTDATALEALDSRQVGKPLRMLVTIKGKREPGYSIPRKIRYRCSQDAGVKCNFCPMFGSGDEEKLIAGSDPVILAMMDANDKQVKDAARVKAEIVKCTKLHTEILEYQSVEVLFARPSVEHTNGNGAGDYKSIKLTSVGRHDTQPNSTVRVVGALQPDPRRQLNEFQAWDVARTESSIDRFSIEHENDIKKLLKFRPRAGQGPLNKLFMIASDFSSHVTFIYGRPEMHALLDLTFHSALSFNFDHKRIQRGWIEVLIIGDTRTGKSEVATRLCDFYNVGEVISCESATFAGIVGGLQQYGATKEWSINWGAIPINDRRLVVLDEAGGLSTDEIAAMSSVRSSGVAELTKIQQERTWARTRIIWMSNPRESKMSDSTYGVQQIAPLIGKPEDIARFDMAMSVKTGEVPMEEINRPHRAGEQRYDSESCSMLIRWVWSRTPDQIIWTKLAEQTVYKLANDMGRRYVEDPPLIQAANVREKIARFSVAIAARLFSTDKSYEKILVRKEHVFAAVAFMDRVYNMPGFGYAERSRELIRDRREAKGQVGSIREFLGNKPGLGKFLRGAGKFRRQDIEEVLNVDREEANAIISTLYDARMVRKLKGDIWVEPTLHDLLRRVQ
jgi:hypothetical protein